ncbi:MAG: ATP-binding protein [Actinomycetota bacterium]|nr:ATP-binding protein [Actinomycetota bacterium]
MTASSFFGQLNSSNQLINQLAGHRGLAEIYAHLIAGAFLFCASLLAILMICLNFGRRGQGWFALRMGIFFVGLIGLGETAEHFFPPKGHDFFHYLHMLAAPMSLFFLYLAVDELRLLYFDLEPKRIISNKNIYLIAAATVFLAAGLGSQSTARWDRALELPFLTITVIPTLVIAYLLIGKSIELYWAQNRVPLFNLSIFSTNLALIPLLTWGTVVLSVVIWLGRVAGYINWAPGYVVFHTIQDLFLASIGASLMSSSLMMLLSRNTKTTENRLIQSAKLVSLGEMTANLAKDLNNPLMSIIGYSSLMLEDRKIPAARRKDLETIQQEAARAAKITQDLLDYTGKRQSRYQVVDIELPLDQALSLMESRLRQTDITVVKNTKRPLPFISADFDQIKQAFVNVMNNAIDAMPRGGRLEIYVTKDGGQVEVSFADSGDGMSEEMLERIFEPFFSSKTEGGTGLGLSLAHSVIRQHNGSIDVSSSPGFGTNFTIKLPAVPDEESLWHMDLGLDAISQTHRVI